MALQEIDTTGNEATGVTLAKIKEMFEELYGSGEAAEMASLDVSGAAQVGSLNVGQGLVKTASATAGAATLTSPSGTVTSEALTTAAGADYTLTITNTEIAATDIVIPTLNNGTNTQGLPLIKSVAPAAGSVVIVVRNTHASQALNGTLKIGFLVVKV